MRVKSLVMCAALVMTSAISVSAGLQPIGQQPVGALSGKVIYVHAGHGWYADATSWWLQRSILFEVVEDLNNQDAMTYFVEYLWNAGATIVPLRPVGHQSEDVVLDNDDPEVEFVGSWSDGTSAVYFGDSGDTPFRFASTSPTENAYARYRPDLPQSGFWPVYSWVGHGADRVAQVYRIHHAGGATEVSVDHRVVGNGLVYLGTFYFEQGTSGHVDVSNENSDAGVVIADMIRFGNGMGDVWRSGPGSTSGQPREDEAGLYWIEAHAGQGIPESEWRVVDETMELIATVTAPSRWAEQMNRESAGAMTDRVYVSYHGNSSTGADRGALALVHDATPTPNQQELGELIIGEIDADMSALDDGFEHSWIDRVSDTFQGPFSEISNAHIFGEFDATVIERGFLDNAVDVELLRDPKVNIVLARATYQGLVRYFNQFDGGVTPLAFLPDPVTDLQAVSNGDGTISLSWTGPTPDGIGGDAPSGYRVYASTNGRGFDGGTYVAGGGTVSHTMTGLDSGDGPHYFKVVATNSAGESLGSEVLAATPLNVQSPVLIVSGYDRIDRNSNPLQVLEGVPAYEGTPVYRVRSRSSNSRDYPVQVAEAIEAFDPALGIDSAANEMVIQGEALLGDYQTIVWILGLESVDDHTFDPTEQALVASYVESGGDLFVSGSEIGFDLVGFSNGEPFYTDILHADYVSDDANTSSVQGEAGSIFEGLAFEFNRDGLQFFQVHLPDDISPRAGASQALTYVGGSNGGAGIQRMSAEGNGSVVMFGFPFEAILGEQARADVMAAVLEFLPMESPEGPIEVTDITASAASIDGTVGDGEYVAYSAGINSGFGDVVGWTSQLHVDSDESGALHWGLVTGEGGLLDKMVVYVDSRPGGFEDTSTFVDNSDPLRAAISATGVYNVNGRADVFFPDGFAADFAIGLESAFAGVWELVDPANHTYVTGAPPTTATARHWEFGFALADLGLEPGDSFDYIVTYGNPLDAGGFFRSDEFHGVSGETVPPGNVGIGTLTLAAGDFNTFNSFSPTVSVDDPVPVHVTRVLGAHPTPFGPRTELFFELGEPAPVSLVIHDPSGRRVRTLLENVWFDAGRHSVTWRGRDTWRKLLPGGVYFFRFQAGACEDRGRLVLVN